MVVLVHHQQVQKLIIQKTESFDRKLHFESLCLPPYLFCVFSFLFSSQEVVNTGLSKKGPVPGDSCRYFLSFQIPKRKRLPPIGKSELNLNELDALTQKFPEEIAENRNVLRSEILLLKCSISLTPSLRLDLSKSSSCYTGSAVIRHQCPLFSRSDDGGTGVHFQ